MILHIASFRWKDEVTPDDVSAVTDALREMAAAVRSAVTTADASPTPRKISAGVISAPPPIPVSPTTMPTTKPATTIDVASEVSQVPMGAVLPGKVGQRNVYR